MWATVCQVFDCWALCSFLVAKAQKQDHHTKKPLCRNSQKRLKQCRAIMRVRDSNFEVPPKSRLWIYRKRARRLLLPRCYITSTVKINELHQLPMRREKKIHYGPDLWILGQPLTQKMANFFAICRCAKLAGEFPVKMRSCIAHVEV